MRKLLSTWFRSTNIIAVSCYSIYLHLWGMTFWKHTWNLPSFENLLLRIYWVNTKQVGWNTRIIILLIFNFVYFYKIYDRIVTFVFINMIYELLQINYIFWSTWLFFINKTIIDIGKPIKRNAIKIL